MQLEPPNQDEGDDERPREALVTIAQARSEFEAGVLVSILTDAGIEAHAFDRFRQALPFQSHFTAIPVQVRAGDAERAKEALAQRITDSIDIDWDEVDVGEREDHLPFGRLGKMPLPIQIAFSLALVIIFVTLFMFILSLLF